MKLILVVLIAISAQSVNSEDQLMQDLPDEVVSDVLTILSHGIVKALGNCTVNPKTPQVSYWLYTRQHENYEEIQNASQVDFKKPVIFLAHGWGGNKDSPYITAIRDAYIKRYDANVIAIDYGAYVKGDYFSSYCDLPQVAKNVAKFFCDLNAFVPLKSVHLVGHSMGGQLAGLTGSSTQKMCASIGRITALDPAGPLYQNIHEDLRLDKTDADFVDVIHTNEGQYGYIGNAGHVDFYPNCGYFQPGCEKIIFNSNFSLDNFVTIATDVIRCNHQRSCFLFAESINRNGFHSTSCDTCGTSVCVKEFVTPHHTYMGENCRSAQAQQEYTLETASKPSYGLGPIQA